MKGTEKGSACKPVSTDAECTYLRVLVAGAASGAYDGTDSPMAEVMADAWAVEPVAPSRLDASKVFVCYLTLSPSGYSGQKQDVISITSKVYKQINIFKHQTKILLIS